MVQDYFVRKVDGEWKLVSGDVFIDFHDAVKEGVGVMLNGLAGVLTDELRVYNPYLVEGNKKYCMWFDLQPLHLK